MSQCRNVDFETKIASRNVAMSQRRNVAIVVSEKDCEFVAMSQCRNATILADADLWILTQHTRPSIF